MTSASTSGDLDEPWALRHGKAIVIVGGAATVLMGLLAVFVLPTIDRVVGNFTDGDLQRARADLRASGLALATGLGAATAGLLAWGRLELSRRQHQLDRARDAALERDRNTQRHLAEQSQTNDRFTRAVELLGHEDRAVRLGALYALEGLAKDGYEPQAVYDVICAFARLHVPQFLDVAVESSGPAFDVDAELADQVANEFAGSTSEEPELGKLPNPEPPEDYEAALRIALRVDDAADIQLNLNGTLLISHKVSSMVNCTLRNSLVIGCHFVNASIVRVDFALARLQRCAFDGADFASCAFGEALLESCSFDGSTYDASTEWPQGSAPDGGSARS